MRRFAQVLSGIVLLFGVTAVIGLGSAAARASREAVDGQGTGSARIKGGHVDFIAEGQSIAANRPSMLNLHLRIDPGYHINSHTPKSDMLIPTRLLVEDMNGAVVEAVDFPAGTPYSFAFEPKTRLDVYTGDVTLQARVKAQPGNYILKGALHYQACDQAACYPPKTQPVEQPFTVK